MISKIFVPVFIILGIVCCKVAEPLTLQRMDFRFSNLKTQGYYYNCDVEYCYPFYLFKNGVYLSCGAMHPKEQRLIDSTVTDLKFIERLKNAQYGWGVFKITTNDIRIEEWLQGNGGPYPTQIYIGEIMNDSSIVITGLRGEKYKSEIDTFKFRYLAMKPDSTNIFIK